jgi:hypothetical protein
MSYQGPGWYRHYKGGEYEVLGLSVAEWTKPEGDDNWYGVMTLVVYRPIPTFQHESLLPGPQGQEWWVRPLGEKDAVLTDKPDDYFDAIVKLKVRPINAPGTVPRFTYLGPMAA